ncbi:imelysin family protein [Flavobacteriaceae bacterium GF1]
MNRRFFWTLPVFLALFIWACSSDGTDDTNGGADDDLGLTDDDGASVTFERGVMLANWADNIIIPSYNGFLTTFASFKAEFDTFQNDRNEANLTNLRQTWIAAYKSWQYVSMFEIGPAEEDGLRLNINTYPTDFELIDSHIANGSYNFELPSNRDTKGFPALDYLFSGIADSDAEIVAMYTDPTTGDAHITYVQDVMDDIETRVTSVRDAWQNGYRDTFVENDGASATASVDRYVNDFIFYYEKFLRAGKMGIPLGVFTGTVAPQTIEAFYSEGLSNELFLEGLDAVQGFFNGKHFGSAQTGESLASYLQNLNTLKDEEALDELINVQFNTARDRVSALGAFKTEIENNDSPTAMFLAYDEVQRAVPLLKVDMVSAMSISIDFVDADGD